MIPEFIKKLILLLALTHVQNSGQAWLPIIMASGAKRRDFSDFNSGVIDRVHLAGASVTKTTQLAKIS
uniref:Uncharacterized protein n=1 Tax=Anguilla anguilla TaxID=7936 RepID=A0A0E9X455_ANGAN